MDYGPANIVVNDFQQKSFKYISRRIPGTAYTFKYYTKDNYCCASCFKLGKIRSVTVRNNRIVVQKDQEDGQHLNCHPIAEETGMNWLVYFLYNY